MRAVEGDRTKERDEVCERETYKQIEIYLERDSQKQRQRVQEQQKKLREIERGVVEYMRR